MRKHMIWLLSSVYIFSLLIIGLLYTWFPSTKSWIEVTKIGLSWPVLLIFFLSSFIYLFEEPIRNFMYKIKGIQTERIRIETQQEDDNSFIPIETVHNFVSIRDSEWQKALDEVALAAQAQLEEKEQDAENLNFLINELQEMIVTIESERIKWQFKYADRYFVARTKLVLKLISIEGTVTPEVLWEKYADIFADLEERNAVIHALLDINFIESQLNEYFISEMGKLYIRYLEDTSKVNWGILRSVIVNARNK